MQFYFILFIFYIFNLYLKLKFYWKLVILNNYHNYNFLNNVNFFNFVFNFFIIIDMCSFFDDFLCIVL